MKKKITRVHGHTIDELSILLQNASNVIDSTITLDPFLLGGWSNINIHGQSADCKFVLKLPYLIQKYEKNPYLFLYNTNRFLSKYSLCPQPLEFGILPDSKKTPFILLEYIEGKTYESVSELSNDEIELLRESITTLSELKPPHLPVFNSPSEYLQKIYDSIEIHECAMKRSNSTEELREDFNALSSDIFSITDAYGEWSKKTMHGDLWIPNVLYCGNKALFLDMEDCAIGDSNYDIAYLLEASNTREVIHPLKLTTPENVENVNKLLPLVLTYLIGWCITRLLLTESRQVESSISTPSIMNSVKDYAKMKLNRLRALIN